MNDEVASAFRRAAIRRLRDEFLPRLRKAVTLLDHQALWQRENEHTNSVGNLLLHLEGNVRQWILSGLGGRPDRRRRELEFHPVEEEAAESLLSRLESTVLEAVDVIEPLMREKLLEHSAEDLFYRGQENRIPLARVPTMAELNCTSPM